MTLDNVINPCMWTYNETVVDQVPDGVIGFVYEITCNTTGKRYIGKKQMTKAITRPPLKGKVRKRRSVGESDWRGYYGSSDSLKADIEERGCETFTRRILRYCATKSEMSYFETKAIFETDAIISSDYYNSWVSVKVARNQLSALCANVAGI